MHRIVSRITLSFVILLAAFLGATAEASADNLLQSARHFSTPYDETVNDFTVHDVTGDGILDMVVTNEYSEGYFPLVVTLPGLGDGTYGDPIRTETTLTRGQVLSLASGHLDDDPHLDLVLTLLDDFTTDFGLIVLLGDGDGHFTVSDHHDLDHATYDVVAADFTGDGVTDFFIAGREWSDKSVHLYQGAGDGTFTEIDNIGLTLRPWKLAAGDFDNDGDQDLAVGDSLEEFITILLNDGAGTFSLQNYDAPNWVANIACGDLDDDGCDDLVVCAGYSEEEVWIHFGDESGTLSPYVEFTVGNGIQFIALGDMDDDGDLDIAADGYESGYIVSGKVITLLNNGDGTFADPYYCFRQALNISLGDMNGDGILDAVVGGPGGDYTYMSVLPGLGDGKFMVMTDLQIEGFGHGVAQADIDLDGDRDVALSQSNGDDQVHILKNNGDGSFSGPESYFVGVGPQHTIFADLTGDGYPEMIAANDASSDDYGVSVMTNAGDGTFYGRRTFAVGYNTASVRAGDLDGDGDLDLAACSDPWLGVLINPGDGLFTGVETYRGPSRAIDLVLGDVDGDGDLDAVAIGGIDGNEGPALMTNNGDGSFTKPELVGGTDFYEPAGLCLSDFDGDGDPDLAFSTGGSYNPEVRILLNNGAGVFTADPDPYPGGEQTVKLEACDLDLDGHVDLVAGNVGSGDIAFLPGQGDGTFGPPRSYPQGQGVQDLELGDFDGNGSPDVLVSGADSNSGSIFFSSLSSTGLLATGPGRGEFNPTLVRIFPAAGSGDHSAQWSAYGVDRWGVNVALGQLDGSSGPEVLTGAGPGPIFGPHVRGFDITGTPLAGVSFLAYGTNKWGVNVAAGDIDNDGYDEIVTGAGPGAVFGPHVRGWNWDGSGKPQPIPGISFFAYGTPKWGVNVSCGDIDGDGYDEIVTGAGPGAVYGPHVRGWNCDGGGAAAIPQVSFLAYGTNKYGVNVCCGDIDGDGIDELVTGAGPGAVFGPHVRAWNWDGSGTTQSIPAVSFFAYQYPKWGVNVSCGDLDDDGIDEIITGPGPGPDYPAQVRGFDYDGLTLSALGGVDFIAYGGEGSRYGVKVAGTN